MSRYVSLVLVRPHSRRSSSRPRTQTVHKSSFARKPTASNPNLKIPTLSPLCFHGLTNCFSRNPFIFKNICVAPPECAPQSRLSEQQLRRLADHAPLSSSLSSNCALLFSLAALFRTPILCFQQLADSLRKNRGGGGTLHIRT